jgi:hypothetical protein
MARAMTVTGGLHQVLAEIFSVLNVFLASQAGFDWQMSRLGYDQAKVIPL